VNKLNNFGLRFRACMKDCMSKAGPTVS
jgi:hypothetical protein